MESLEALKTIFINCKDLLVNKNGEVVKLEDLIKTIKQDLERLEELVDEYNNLKQDYDIRDLECCDLQVENEKLKQENKEYRKAVKSWNDSIPKLIHENTKLKQALDIIKTKKVDVFELKFSYSVIEYNIMARNSDFDELTQEEHELLKEVL